MNEKAGRPESNADNVSIREHGNSASYTIKRLAKLGLKVNPNGVRSSFDNSGNIKANQGGTSAAYTNALPS